MACVLGFQELASHNPFVQHLMDELYLPDFVGTYFVIRSLTYLDERGGLQFGDLATPIELSGDGVIQPPTPTGHQAWFRGGRPHNPDGTQVHLGGGPQRIVIAADFETDQSFSCKLTDDQTGQLRPYHSFEEKIRTYLDKITGPAVAKFPDSRTRRAIAARVEEQGTPLRYPDMLSSKYHMNDLSRLLVGKRVAIIGLGGTGSYILDFIARTHLAEIALFDDDAVLADTIFRYPGFIPGALNNKKKVHALSEQYANWHSNITAVAERVTADNIESLALFDFTFVSIDDGPSRIFIVDWLSQRGIPFVDTGMGLNRVPGGLNGVARITGVDRTAFEETARTVFLPGERPEEDDYRRQAQIAELNALNAALAVIRFKQHFEIYERMDESPSCIFETSSFDIDRPVRTE